MSEYNRKRNFAVTSEPRDEQMPVHKKVAHALQFVIQKHDARRLHYDFRLEIDGTLKSWAIPKGPSLDPKDKRLAVHVEDHPLAYANFEGHIPAGHYGGGDVIVWDQGVWQPHGNAAADYAAGKLKFTLIGEKLSGDWTLVRTSLRGSGDKEQWLLIKERDESARAAAEYDVVAAQPASVLSGTLLSIDANKKISINSAKKTPVNAAREPLDAAREKVAQKKGASSTAKKDAGATPKPLPDFFTPQLATLVNQPPSGDWFYEIKYDGYRILSRIEQGKVQLFTRNGNDWTSRMPQLVKALTALKLENSWLDGEVVVLNDQGLPDFQALQRAFEISRSVDIIYYLFDAPFLRGQDLRQTPIEQRRAKLEQVVPSKKGSPLRFSAAFSGDYRNIVASACAMSLEGLIAKRVGSFYVSRRSSDWVKLKCRLRQEFVVVGYTTPQGSRSGFGALLLGVYESSTKNAPLIYAGRVGTGFDAASLTNIHRQLKALVQTHSPLINPPRGVQSKGVHWVVPQLVAEVEFAEWTQEGILRQAAFIALRSDKPAMEIVREQPSALMKPAAGVDASSPGENTKKTSSVQATNKRGSKKNSAQVQEQTKLSSVKEKPSSKEAFSRVAGVRISHPNRVIDAQTGASKLALAEYYAMVGKWLLPHLNNRPVSFLRAPEGVGGETFFQKHAEKLAIPHIHHLPLELDPGHARLMEIRALPALVGAAQMGAIELHTWNATDDAIETPDRFILDLDPDPALPWRSMLEAVNLTLTVLDELGLQGFVKTTGGKGLHMVVPLGRKNSWPAVKGFTKALAEFMAKQIPERFVAKMGPKNRIGKIFVDYLRNQRGASTVCAYSARARPGLPVSVPIAVSELQDLKSSAEWHIGNLQERLLSLKKDPWSGYQHKQTITGRMWQKLGVKEIK